MSRFQVAAETGGDEDDSEYDSENEIHENFDETSGRCPLWFVWECWKSLGEEEARQRWDNPHPDLAARIQQRAIGLPLETCWEYYQDLLLQEKEVLISNADTEALRYGLARFTSLQKITVTPAAHGILFTPLCETPMIRSSPPGFQYPLPRTWPTMEPDVGIYEVPA
ncbi:hypothetical protein BX600DRAFT_496129 [Xylariales sp. PMI_506]|nr:hypothetical protein BX600DRAFT_496129 [Xylariales sp. PMI_506]